jgi:hypothetical protein
MDQLQPESITLTLKKIHFRSWWRRLLTPFSFGRLLPVRTEHCDEKVVIDMGKLPTTFTLTPYHIVFTLGVNGAFTAVTTDPHYVGKLVGYDVEITYSTPSQSQ